MIQFNLLPDVKLKYVRAQRTKRLMISVSALVTAISLVLFFSVLVYVDVAQKSHLNNINSDIATNSASLTSNSNLNGILTIQNQLSSLPALEKSDPVSTRLFDYLTQVTPADATISSANFDFGAHTIDIDGAADSLNTVNQFVDTLEFATYKLPNSSTTPKAFSTVILTSYSYSTTTGATYDITLNFDPNLFADTAIPVLTVPPGKTTTRSVLDQPSNLFVKAASGAK
jgi:Tfp pilus assembly protein PilN